MPRTTPVHAGYTIINGSGTGAIGGRIHVWVEYGVQKTDITGNRTYLSAYFYAALNPNYTAAVTGQAGLNATFFVDGRKADSVTDGAYDFTDGNKVNLLGSFAGWVTHGADGAKSLALEGRFTTNTSQISGGSLSAVVTLPPIFRAPQPAAADCLLGMPCRVTWTAKHARHSHRLVFSLGEWTYTTQRITPGNTRPFTYTALTLPLEAAKQFSGAQDTMTVELEVYDGDTLLGSATDQFTVTVPDNENTRPTVTATLAPEGTVFPEKYVQLLSKVSAKVIAQDPLDAKILSYTISTGGNTRSGTVSNILDQAGPVTVTVTAKNSRGFTGTYRETIQVLSYSPPQLLTAAAYRCLSDGAADPGGTYLRLTATWSRSPAEEENTCRLRWRYQAEGGQWSQWDEMDATDNADTGPVPGVILEGDKAYNIAMEVVDRAGGTATENFSIPVEQVYMHRTRNAMGLGGYVQAADTLDVHWDLQARRSVNGLYIRTERLFDTREMRVQTKFSAMDGEGYVRQTIFLFGNDNGVPVQGVIGVSDSGNAVWSGMEGVAVSADTATGILTITFPYVGYDRFVFLSPDPIELV